jgi:CHAT domain-containing protein/Tfp pilus assembly protein PilF
MRYSAKLLGLVALTTSMVPCVQKPGFSEETRFLPHPERLQAERTLAITDKPEKRLQLDAMPVGPTAKGVVEQTKQVDDDTAPLLQVEGVLEPGDSTFTDDNSLYDTYTFEAEAGQAVIITLESEEFDTYLLLRDSQGESVAQNDDISDDNRNSSIAVVLPEAGTYQVLAGAYDDTQQGAYRLTVVPTQPDGPVVKKFEAETLFDEALQLWRTSDFQGAWDKLQQALELYQAPDVRQAFPQESRQGEGKTLTGLGAISDSFGQYQQALSYYQQALPIAQEIGDRAGEGTTLNNLGFVYDNLGQYEQALSYYQQALPIRQEIGDRLGEGVTLNNIGGVYDALGQYEQALSYYQQALPIRQEIGDRAGEGVTLNNIGLVYDNLGQYQQALSYYQQALPIRQEIGDRLGEGVTLNNIGGVYDALGQYEQALSYYQQALPIAQEIGDRAGEGTTLNNIGLVYDNLGQYEQALSYYQQALPIAQKIGDRSGRAITLNNIGYVLENLKEPELAIVFLKQSVNQYEAIRGDIRGLATEQQQAFTDSIADTYRKLADLLLQADRVLEAQRVLDLLKVQELDEYLEDVQRNGNTEEGIASRNPEQVINDGLDARLNRVIELNREIRELEALDQLTPEQQDRLIALGQEAQQLIADFNTFLDSPEVQEQVALLRNETGGEALDLSNYRDLQKSLAALEQNAVLLYPFVLEDRLELVLVTPEVDTPLRETVAVDRVTLNEAIANYRSALESPGSDPLPLAQQLYGWLLEPLADELETIGAETIIYAPDGQLRYIPLAALHDGQQWVVEDFRINNITAASLMDIALQTRREPRVFAAAFTEGSYPISVGEYQETFYGLQYAGQEVDNLANLIAGTTKLLNDDFHPETALLMNRYSIVHLATHAAFVPGDPQDSFILFGNGDTVSLVEVREWRLPDVELVVLSACETGLGDELGDGREILGLGYQMQKAGASAAMASLWSVSDGGTQALMDAFYLALQNGYSKAEALRLAQQALIANDLSIVGGERGTIVIKDAATGEPLALQGRLSHPYYWAPFILIGNGL